MVKDELVDNGRVVSIEVVNLIIEIDGDVVEVTALGFQLIIKWERCLSHVYLQHSRTH